MSSTLEDKPKKDEHNLELSDDEYRAYKLIKSEKSIHQSDFWKRLGFSSRKGSRIAHKLEEKTLIKREETVYDGHNTYKLTPVTHAEDLDFSLLMAGDMISPFIDSETTDPMSDSFTRWLMNLTQED